MERQGLRGLAQFFTSAMKDETYPDWSFAMRNSNNLLFRHSCTIMKEQFVLLSNTERENTQIYYYVTSSYVEYMS